MKKTGNYIQKFLIVIAGLVGLLITGSLTLIVISFFNVPEENNKIDYGTEMTEEEKTRAYKEEYMSEFEDEEKDDFESVEASDSPTIEETTRDMEETFTELVQNSFGEHADVRFHEESKTFFIMPMTDDLIIHISDYAEYGTNAEEWNSMKRDLIEMSKLIEDSLGQGYYIKMSNPSDISRTLLEISDGELVSGI